MSTLFAATYPDRVWALVLDRAYARELWAHDYPWGMREADYLASIAQMQQAPMDQAAFERAARKGLGPNATDEEITALARYFRLAATPGALRSLDLMNMQIDVRHVLPAIRIPTLVLHHTGDPWVSVEHGRYVAQHISGATYVELPGDINTAPVADLPPYLDEIERFLKRVWETAPDEESEPDRVLATVLFTDIVGSSERAAALGDRAWRDLLQRHHDVVRRQLLRFRGVEVDTAGDGFFASFDGPARAIRCACSIADGVRELEIEVRAGVHTGECELVDGKVAGIAVHIGARVAALARPGEVLVSSTVKDLVAGSGITFTDRGRVELKGIPGEWQLFAVPHDAAG